MKLTILKVHVYLVIYDISSLTLSVHCSVENADLDDYCNIGDKTYCRLHFRLEFWCELVSDSNAGQQLGGNFHVANISNRGK